MSKNESDTVMTNSMHCLRKKLNPELLENIYETVLMKQLEKKKGLIVQRKVSIPVKFEGKQNNEEFRADISIDGKIIIDLESMEKIPLVYKKQLLAYLRLVNTKLGYILNFGTELMKDGIINIANGLL